MTERVLDWDGCYNVRDLGGLPISGGGVTHHGEIVRSSAAFQLTEAGWRAARTYGIRTVVSLLNPDETAADTSPRPADIATVNVPLDNLDDHDFWDPLIASGHWGTPIYYRAFIERYPETIRTAVSAIADAGSGGVLVHCGRGQDRTGLITMILLTLVGVDIDAIAADHDICLSPETVRLRLAHGEKDDSDRIREIIALAGTTSRDALRSAMDVVNTIEIRDDVRERIRRRLS